jgi:electron transport complex protein RnfG
MSHPPNPFKKALAVMLCLSTLGIGLIVWVEQHSAETIGQNEQGYAERLWSEVLGDLAHDPLVPKKTQCLDLDDHLPPWCFIPVEENQKRIAILVQVTASKGYNGPIQLLVGIKRDETLAGVRVTHHQETPGLGDLLERSKSNWILGFEGKSLKDPAPLSWSTRKEGGQFDAFTGATITPKAVISAVRETLERVQTHRAQFFPD